MLDADAIIVRLVISFIRENADRGLLVAGQEVQRRIGEPVLTHEPWSLGATRVAR